MRRSVSAVFSFILASTLAASTFALLTIVPSARAQRFTVSTIPVPPGGGFLEAYGINWMGAITGSVNIGSNSCTYIYAKGVFHPICSLVDGQGGYASGINYFQQLAGSSDGHGFIYSNGTVAEAGLLPHGTFSGLGTINDYGVATGQADTAPNPYQGYAGLSHAITYSFSSRKLTDLGTLPTGDQSYGLGINNAGEVTGWGDADGDTTYHAFLYTGGSLLDIGAQPGWVASQGIAINNLGQVLGFFYGSDYVNHGFLYQNGTAQDLGAEIFPAAFNDFADIVGTDTITSPEKTGSAALYSNGVVQDLNTLIPAGTGFYLADAVAINDSGQIIGDGVTLDGASPEYVLTPICDRSQYPISDSDLQKNEHWCLAAKGITIIPFSAAFGDVGVGTTSSSITVTIANTSAAPIVFSGVSGLEQFNINKGTCALKEVGNTLPPNAYCTFSVTFSPTQPGAQNGQIQLSTSAGPIVFQVGGTGTNNALKAP